MALNYTLLFDRIGTGLGLILGVNTFRGTTLPAKWVDYVEQFDGEDNPDLRACVTSATDWLAGAKSGLSAIQISAAASIGNAIIEMTDAESPLTQKSLANGVKELARLMIADVQSVDANAVGSSIATGSNSGTGFMLVSQTDGRGKSLEFIYAEVIDVTFTDPTTALCSGEQSAATLLAENWPLGSGSSKSFTAIAPGGATDLLSGGDMETYTVANIPDGWTVVAGTPGTDLGEETGVVYGGAKALKFVGGAATTQIKQTIDGLAAATPYAVNLFCKVDSAPGAGVLTIDLFDGTSVINDENGTANSFTVNLTGLGTTYVAKSGIFRLPEPVPAIVQLRIRLSTALSTTKILYIDHVALGEMTQLYTGGPFAACFVGSTAFSLDDTFGLTMTNDYGGAVHTGLWRALDLPNIGVKIPSNASAGETISDSVIP